MKELLSGAVIRYFNTPRFEKFSTEREYVVQEFSRRGRADIVLLDKDSVPAAIAECKRIGSVENNGIDQLKSYLNASGTELGLFANDTDPYEWIFVKKM